jgi:hypothetical protein
MNGMHRLFEHLFRQLFFAGTWFAAAAPPVSGSDGAASGATPGGAPAAPAAPAPDSSAAPASGQPGAGDVNQNIRQIREAYDGLKAKYEPWDKLGVQPEQVSQFSTVYQKVYGEVASLGRELGYPDEEIAEALAEDPVRTLDFLRNEASRIQQGGQERGGQEDLQDLVAQHVEQAIAPIQQRENLRMTNEANSLFERVAYQELAEIFKGEGIDAASIPQEEKDFILAQASEMLKYDENALRDLKYNGKTAAVQKAVRDVMSQVDKYYLSRSGRDRARVQPARPGQAAAPQGGKKPTLDEMIENPSLIDEAQGRQGADGRYR